MKAKFVGVMSGLIVFFTLLLVGCGPADNDLYTSQNLVHDVVEFTHQLKDGRTVTCIFVAQRSGLSCDFPPYGQ